MPYQNNPYFLSPEEQQQIAGIPPMMQNIGQQQANQQAALAQGAQLAQQASQVTGNGQGGNMAMAMALRKGKEKGPGLGETTNDAGKVIADPTYGNGGKYGKMTKEELANMMESGL